MPSVAQIALGMRVSEVAGGALARMGCLDADAIEAADALLARVAGSEIETIRVVFPDQHGSAVGLSSAVEQTDYNAIEIKGDRHD